MVNREYIEISWTTDRIELARIVSASLVDKHLVACAQIFPLVESFYLWKEALEKAQEVKVLFKTHLAHYDSIEKFVIKNSGYDLPEITYRRIDGGSSGYLNWMEENL